jgi:motility quorum-sensing regulator/GCU-specific mRNA interferase toxin
MSNPTYALNTIQSLIRSGRYRVTLSAKQGAQEMGMDTADMETCVLGLTARDFYKTMPAEKVQGLFQDVYRPRFQGWDVYLKLQITGDAVVISFKQR